MVAMDEVAVLIDTKAEAEGSEADTIYPKRRSYSYSQGRNKE